MKTYNATSLKNWIDQNLPPISWRVIQLSCFNEFLADGISIKDIDNATTFSRNLTIKIKEETFIRYKIKLPIENFENKTLVLST